MERLDARRDENESARCQHQRNLGRDDVATSSESVVSTACHPKDVSVSGP